MRFEVGTNLHDEDLNASSGDSRRSGENAARQPPESHAIARLASSSLRGEFAAISLRRLSSRNAAEAAAFPAISHCSGDPRENQQPPREAWLLLVRRRQGLATRVLGLGLGLGGASATLGRATAPVVRATADSGEGPRSPPAARTSPCSPARRRVIDGPRNLV